MAKSTAAPDREKETNKSSSLHPPYFQMISEAISTLKDRTGSSQKAIAKFLEDKYGKALPPKFKKSLSIQLKRFVKSKRLVKVKNSYKVSLSEKVRSEIKCGANKETEEIMTKKMKKMVVKSETVKSKRLSQIRTPEVMKAAKTTAAAKVVLVGNGAKVKRLSQVKTPEALMKTRKRN